MIAVRDIDQAGEPGWSIDSVLSPHTISEADCTNSKIKQGQWIVDPSKKRNE